ncbi:MAG: transglutaminase domain-containing protein [Lachnospiraceae bacterium]
MNKKISIFAVIFILAALAIHLYLNVPEVQEKIAAYTEEEFREENIYSSLEALAERLDEEILKGSESFVVYLKDVDIDVINDINSSLNGVFGSGSTYQKLGTVGDTYTKVSITIKRTMNYYALQAYRNQEPIPENEEKAKQLYEKIRSILTSQIHDSMTDYEKELALHDYLVANCKYSEDVAQPSESDIYRAYGALVNQDAVCNGYAEALQLLFMCAGINSEFVVGTADGVDHAWNLVELDGKWYHLDATWDDPLPDQGESVIHPYFNVTDEVMQQSHSWEQEDYPAADSMDYNYYVKSQTYFDDFDIYKEQAYEAMIYHGNRRYEAVIENYVENEDDMQFIFENNYRYDSVNWQTFREGSYCVLVLNAE